MGSQPEPLPLSFRRATTSDIPLLLPLISRAYRGDASRAGWTTEADLVTGDRIDAAGLSEKITHPDAAVLVGADSASDSIVSCCEVVHLAGTKTGYFGLFAVDPLLQGGGIGKSVMRFAEEFARSEWGVERMELTVIWTRTELLAWYARRGYMKTGERREFPWELLKEMKGKALRDDLSFEVLVKQLVEPGKEVEV